MHFPMCCACVHDVTDSGSRFNCLYLGIIKSFLRMKKIYSLSFLMLALGISSMKAQSGSQSFTASGVFVVPAGVTTITVELLGAGGSGGGNGGGGGGGGGYTSSVVTVNPGDSISITIGAAGGGTIGGTSAIPAFNMVALGGDNGTSVANPNIGGGGTGGVASGGNIVNFTGGNGGGGYWTYFGGGGGGAAGPMGNGTAGGNTIAWTGMCQTPGGAYGPGGGAPGGDGGKGAGFTDVNCSVSDPAGNGMNYGGGGGGGNGNGGVPGTGVDGYCYITWGPAGVSHANTAASISVSPNPFTERIMVQNAKGTETYQLMSATGQLLWSGMNIQREDFSWLSPGIYLLQVTNEGNTQTTKVVKQ
jgi:hypothetical protein